MNRRDFLKTTTAASMLAGLAGASGAEAATSPSRARIVIAGAGAAGLSLAARFRRQMPEARTTIIDAKTDHHFQPGLTLVGAGLWTPGDITFRNADFIPRDVEWIADSVAEFDPDANVVITGSRQRIDYDFLMVATGLMLDYARIDGMGEALIGREGIASIYAGPDAAEASFGVIENFIEQGGTGLFGRPETEMKCAGAPLKMTFITDDLARRRGRRGEVELI